MAVEIITIVPEHVHKVNIQWEQRGALAASHSYTYVVERSGSPDGPWETITSTPLTDILHFKDENANLFSFDRDIYYRVIATNNSNSAVYTSNVKNMMGDFDRRRYLLWRKMNYDEEIMLKKGNGVPIKVLKRKHFGARCPDCYDPKTGTLLSSHCNTCKGAGWLGGYYKPISTWGHIKPSSTRTSDMNDSSIPNVETANGFLLNFPKVVKDDILVETLTNTRWRVDTAQSTELIRAAVHQDIVLQRVPIDAIEHTLEV